MLESLDARAAGRYEFIPLGSNCDVSHWLRKRNFRQNAYPFDWNVTPLASACDLLESDFAAFFEPENLVCLDPVPRLLFDEGDATVLKVSEEIITPVVCRRHGMLFPHDFSKAGGAEFPVIREKYARRIARFREALAPSSGKTPAFIAVNAPLNAWQEEKYRMAGVAAPDMSPGRFQEDMARLRAVLAARIGGPFVVATLDEAMAALPERSGWMAGVRRRFTDFLKGGNQDGH